MADRYLNIRVEESLEQWNTIQTTRGKMRSCVMLQGDSNAFVTIMNAMVNIIKRVVYQCIMSYIDNIIIDFRLYEEHVRELKKVFQQLEEQKFPFRESKCQFFARKLETFGHILNLDGLHVNTKKRKTILEFPTPACKKDLCGFLVVAN